MQHKLVSRHQWIAARKAHLANEKALTKARDKLSAERRALPWVKVEKDYVFETLDGNKTLGDLFDGRSQLIVYHFMLGPDWGGSVCGSIAAALRRRRSRSLDATKSFRVRAATPPDPLHRRDRPRSPDAKTGKAPMKEPARRYLSW